MAPSDGNPPNGARRPEDEDLLQAQDAYDGPEPSLTESNDLHVRSPVPSDAEYEARLPLPVWMRESSKSFRWRWIPLRVRKFARSIGHYANKTNQWSYGPKEAQIQRINFPLVEEAPLWLVDKFLPKKVHKIVALLLLYLAWFLTFFFVIRESATSGNIEDYGVPSSIWCGASFW